MAGQLIEMFQNTIGDQVIRYASASFGESAEHISSAMDMVLPAFMASLIQKGQSATGAKDLGQYLRHNQLDGNALAQIHTTLQDAGHAEELMASGATHLNYLFGSSLSSIVDAVAGANGLKTSSSAALLKLTAPLFLHVTGRFIQEKSLDTPGIKQLLLSQSPEVSQRLPSSLSFLSTPLETTAPEPSATRKAETPSVPEPPTGSSRYLPWIILLLTSLGLFYLVEKGCGRTTSEKNPDTEIQEDQGPIPAGADTIQHDTI